jgi:Cys-rich four helix bundle protein (predicted Tat secretion target)
MAIPGLLDNPGGIHYAQPRRIHPMPISRRDLLASGAAIGTTLGLGLGVAFAADEAPAKAPASAGLAEAAAECVRIGEECLQHCLVLLSQGDTSLGDCAKSVTQMLAVCRAAGPLVHADSKHLQAFAKLCAGVCSDCETACRKHEGHHAICKQCAEACAKTVAAAKKLAA